MTFPRRAKGVLASVAAVLLGGIGLVAYGELRPLPEPTFTGDLASVLPTAEEVPGWQIKREEIADTPEMKRAVSEILNYDDATYTSYIKDGERISIYIAHWRPGKMPHRLVASHTPDICWVGAGWQRARAGVAEALPISSGAAAAPAEHREMRRHFQSEWVLFWHIVGDDRVSYGTEVPPWHASITDTLARGLNQRDEQFFIRISSPRPVEKWWTTDVVQTLVRKMRPHGVKI